jgi:hypothetical protein
MRRLCTDSRARSNEMNVSLSRDLLTYTDEVIPISNIDASDQTCLLGLHSDAEALVHSIQNVGLINPPLLMDKGNGRSAYGSWQKVSQNPSWSESPFGITDRIAL